jgi:hypothetical protein
MTEPKKPNQFLSTHHPTKLLSTAPLAFLLELFCCPKFVALIYGDFITHHHAYLVNICQLLHFILCVFLKNICCDYLAALALEYIIVALQVLNLIWQLKRNLQCRATFFALLFLTQK